MGLIARKKGLWARFEGLSARHKAACRERLETIEMVAQASAAGISRTASVLLAARRGGVSERTVYNWIELTDGVDREDWLAALAPSFEGVSERADCDPRAWEFLISDYLRLEGPKFSPCYRRMLTAAARHGWSPIPAERALRRRLEAEVPKSVQTLSRKGADRAKGLYPAQRRSRAHLHSLQMVNMDGHRLDVFVRAPWSDLPLRMHLVAIQDLYSGKILAWRLAQPLTQATGRNFWSFPTLRCEPTMNKAVSLKRDAVPHPDGPNRDGNGLINSCYSNKDWNDRAHAAFLSAFNNLEFAEYHLGSRSPSPDAWHSSYDEGLRPVF